MLLGSMMMDRDTSCTRSYGQNLDRSYDVLTGNQQDGNAIGHGGACSNTGVACRLRSSS